MKLTKVALLTFGLAVAAAPLQAEPAGTLSLSLEHQAAAEGIRIAIKVTNTASQTVTLQKANAKGQAELDYAVSVTRLDKRPVAETDYARSLDGRGTMAIGGSNRRIVLRRGETVTDSLMLDRLYDVKSPGVYLVAVHPREPGANRYRQAEPLRVVVK